MVAIPIRPSIWGSARPRSAGAAPAQTAALVTSVILTGSSPSNSPASAACSDQPCARWLAANSSGIWPAASTKRDKIDRLAPFGRFLGAPGRRHLADDGWQHRGSIPPADNVQALERLVDEVERVSAVGEGPLGHGGEQGVGERSARKTGGDPGEQGALGRLAVANLCPTPEPAFERGLFRPAFEGRALPPRWLPVAVRRHTARPVEQGEIGFVLGQSGQQIGECGEDRETDAPAVPVLGPEQRRLPYDVGFRCAGREPALHRLGDDEADVVLEAVIKPLAPVRSGVGMTEGCLDPDLLVAHLDRESRGVIRPQIEGAAAFEVETGVVPMAREDAVLDAAPVEREAHVRAPIVERKDPPAIIDDEDRTMGAMHDEPALRLQLFEAPCKR